MLFELILTLAVLIGGVLAAIDKFYLEKRRTADDPMPMVMDYARSLFPVLLIVLVLRSFVAEPFRIPSGSMYPTLHIGDFILVNKMSYGIRLPVIYNTLIETGKPDRGDVAVFRYPVEPDKDYIKRVVGLPGDKISYIAKTLYVNGQRIEQTHLGRYQTEGSGAVMNGAYLLDEDLLGVQHQILIDKDRPAGDLLEVVVPEGHYFMVGDNRDHSYDSRFWGFVPEENLKGRAFFIWMHFDSGIDFSRIGLSIR
jgi:signal peptidase I